MEGDGLREGLADLLGDLPPGVELVAALAEVDLTALSSSELALVVAARFRQLNHDQGQLLAAALELGLTPYFTLDGPTARLAELEVNSADQVGPVVHWSRDTSVPFLHLADAVVRRLPMVHAAMLAGLLELKKAEAFSRYLRHLDVDTAREIAARFVDRAPNWSLEWLRVKLRCAAIDADPASAKQRYDRSVVGPPRPVRAARGRHGEYRGVLAARGRGGGGEEQHRTVSPGRESRRRQTADAATAGGAYLDLLRGIPFRLAPTVDAVTAHADAAERDEFPFAGAQDAAITAEGDARAAAEATHAAQAADVAAQVARALARESARAAAMARAEAEQQTRPLATAATADQGTSPGTADGADQGTDQLADRLADSIGGSSGGPGNGPGVGGSGRVLSLRGVGRAVMTLPRPVGAWT